MPTERYDAAVAGGGLTGLLAAASLARAGFEVVVVEGRERGAEGDGRVSALTVASERILRRLGAWERITGAASFRRMRVWEASGGAEIRFDARAVGAEHLGHIVENRVIAEALEEVVESLGVAWSRPSRVAGLELGRGEVTVELGRSPGRAEGRARVRSRIRAGLLVGADGGDSVVRSLVGIPARGRDYRQLGIVCSVRPERHHRDTAWQVARRPGRSRSSAAGGSLLDRLVDRTGARGAPSRARGRCVPTRARDRLRGPARGHRMGRAPGRLPAPRDPGRDLLGPARRPCR